MPRRKNCTPSKSLSSNKNWSWINENTTETESSNISVKKQKREIIYTATKYKFEEEKYLITRINLGITNNVLPENWLKCKISFIENNIKLNFDNKEYVIVQLSCSYDNIFLLDIFSTRMFTINFEVNVYTKAIDLMLYFSQSQISKFTLKIGKILQKLMTTFFNIDSRDVYDDLILKNHENVEDLYKSVQNCRNNDTASNCDINFQHPNLLPKLRPYQLDAVKWMLQREQNMHKTESLHLLYTTITLHSGAEIYYNKYTGYLDTVKPLVEYVNSGGILADEMGLGKTVEVLACILNNPRSTQEHVNENFEEDNNEQEINNLNDTIPKIETQAKFINPRKTIKKKKKVECKRKFNKTLEKSAARRAAQIWYESKLAEMVIKKKTVIPVEEVQCICGDFSKIGLVACRDCDKKQHARCLGYKKVDKNYICPQCWVNQPLIESKATLIVSPMAISRQWSLEVQQHIRQNGLKVLEYKGLQNFGVIYPTELASYDLVVTTYNVLQMEMRFSGAEEPSGSVELRHAKRYHAPASPLRRIAWWRLCLDEAQYVEGSTGLVASMARSLNAVHRWAVTGTPVQKHLTDLYGLINYLQLAPYDNMDTWNYALYYPYINGNKQPMIDFLSKVLWRSAKADVLGQINIPMQTIQEHWLEFSAVEKYFYNREHESCAKDFLIKLNRFESLDISLKSIDRQTLNFILHPLLSLRQACTHPYAVRGRYLTSKRQVKSMEELLDVLIKKNLNDCEESLRAIIASLNGMAGILLLQEKRLDAVEKYREALTYCMHQYEGFLKIDKLQRIHTLHNLNEVLKDKRQPAPPPTLRDEQLEEECALYQSRYMERFIEETRGALQEVNDATNVVNSCHKQFRCKEGVCFAEIIDWLIEHNTENELCRRVETVAMESGFKQKYQVISGGREISYLVTIWIDKIAKHLQGLRKLFEVLKNVFISEENQNYINEDIVEKAMECHLRPGKVKKPKYTCMCCVLDAKLKKYECVVFQMNTKQNKNESNKGTWNPCFEEKVIKAVNAIAKQRGAPAELISDSTAYIRLCEARRKEFKALRKLYTFFDAQVSAQDELNICKIRFRLRNPDEPIKVIPKKISILENLNYEIENKYEFIHVINEYELDMNYNVLKEEKISNEEKLKKMLGTHSYLETLRKQQYAGQNPDPCPICNLQLSESWSILPCGHCYCLECIHKLLEQYSLGKYVQCSVCRTKQPCNDISYIKMQNSPQSTIDDIKIKGSYSTKIHAVVHCVLKLKHSEPDVKVLIFSTWIAVLKALSDAFTANDIVHEYVMSTNLQEKLQRFKDYKRKVTALLLPIRLGANGLNLTEATHVLLVEPLMNLGQELQAIGRVHRIGQLKPSFVHRFLIKNTIEEKIHNAISTNAQQWDDNKLTLDELKRLFSEHNNSVCNEETE